MCLKEQSDRSHYLLWCAVLDFVHVWKTKTTLTNIQSFQGFTGSLVRRQTTTTTIQLFAHESLSRDTRGFDIWKMWCLNWDEYLSSCFTWVFGSVEREREIGKDFHADWRTRGSRCIDAVIRDVSSTIARCFTLKLYEWRSKLRENVWNDEIYFEIVSSEDTLYYNREMRI